MEFRFALKTKDEDKLIQWNDISHWNLLLKGNIKEKLGIKNSFDMNAEGYIAIVRFSR